MSFIKTKEEDMYKCTYCGNWKADGEGLHESEDSVTRCIYCGNLSFEKTNVKWENLMDNNNVM